MILLAIALTQAPQAECTWRRCGHSNGKLINCEKPETGTPQELALVVAMTKRGALTWECKGVDPR